jgi:hypothetical protein
MAEASGSKGEKGTPPPKTPHQALSKNELERLTEVFKMYETGLREAAIYPKVN